MKGNAAGNTLSVFEIVVITSMPTIGIVLTDVERLWSQLIQFVGRFMLLGGVDMAMVVESTSVGVSVLDFLAVVVGSILWLVQTNFLIFW